jgi:hypothetical protein
MQVEGGAYLMHDSQSARTLSVETAHIDGDAHCTRPCGEKRLSNIEDGCAGGTDAQFAEALEGAITLLAGRYLHECVSAHLGDDSLRVGDHLVCGVAHHLEIELDVISYERSYLAGALEEGSIGALKCTDGNGRVISEAVAGVDVRYTSYFLGIHADQTELNHRWPSFKKDLAL